MSAIEDVVSLTSIEDVVSLHSITTMVYPVKFRGRIDGWRNSG